MTGAWRSASASTSTASSPSHSPSGSGLAGLGGALGINTLGLDPSFPIEYLVFFLIVVSIGGTRLG